jgi:hypothetical protein
MDLQMLQQHILYFYMHLLFSPIEESEIKWQPLNSINIFLELQQAFQ